MSDAQVYIFCDFDGTVARRDVGYHLFHHFSGGKNVELVRDWKAGLISSREILIREAALISASPVEIYQFLDSFDLSPGFEEFVRLCHCNGSPPVLLSEGMDFYIRYLLSHHGLEGLEVVSNQGELADGTIKIRFPYENRKCRRCGSCKGERIVEYRARHGDRPHTVFIGDGLSDVCAIEHADILFAKKDLERYCQEHGIAYNSFSDFFDVAERMTELGLLKR
jgi:2-hydroxy-3-keto-5-methylthiopentenyl-1-phosphate phosphatase